MSNKGQVASCHYKGTLDDGTVFDSSYDRNEPIEFVCGVGQMIKGFDAAVENMEVGQTINVHIPCADAYGEYDEEACMTIPLAQIPEGDKLPVGETVYFQDQMGYPFPVRVVSKDETNVTLDLNHELAGKDLNFEITLVSLRELEEGEQFGCDCGCEGDCDCGCEGDECCH